MSQKTDLQIYQGDDWAATITVNQGGTAADLTGYTAKAQIRDDYADYEATVRATIQTTVISPDITLFIPRTATLQLDGDYVWDLELTSPDDIVTTLMNGVVHATPEVTR